MLCSLLCDASYVLLCLLCYVTLYLLCYVMFGMLCYVWYVMLCSLLCDVMLAMCCYVCCVVLCYVMLCYVLLCLCYVMLFSVCFFCNLIVIFPHKMHLGMHIFFNSRYLLFWIQQTATLGVLTPTSLYIVTQHKSLAKGILCTKVATLCAISGLKFATALLIRFDFELIQNKVFLFSLQSRQKHFQIGKFCVIRV